jgi:hypothetical protein
MRGLSEVKPVTTSVRRRNAGSEGNGKPTWFGRFGHGECVLDGDGYGAAERRTTEEQSHRGEGGDLNRSTRRKRREVVTAVVQNLQLFAAICTYLHLFALICTYLHLFSFRRGGPSPSDFDAARRGGPQGSRPVNP